MRIFVVPRYFVEKQIDKNQDWILGKWIISIFSKAGFSPIPVDRYNILKLQFDDVSDRDFDCAGNLVFFDQALASQVWDFIKQIRDDGSKPFYIHCDAGVSRSGAVGYMLNEYFNKFLDNRAADREAFERDNSHIMPNPLVVRLLKQEFFGNDYRGVFTNDYTFVQLPPRQA